MNTRIKGVGSFAILLLKFSLNKVIIRMTGAKRALVKERKVYDLRGSHAQPSGSN